MAFLFKAKAKTPGEIVRGLKEFISKLESSGDRKKVGEEISKNLAAMKAILYGEGGNE